MPEDYTIEQLEKTFKEHTEKFEFQKSLNYGNPQKVLQDFNISEALHVICREINQIKRQRSEDIRCKSMNRFSQLPISID